MTVQERKERALQKKKRQLAKRRMVILLATVLLITIGSIVFGSIFSSAKSDKADEVQYKYYKSIVIEKGDSLWSIAEEYHPVDCSTKEYVKELKQINNLGSDTIHEGQHLMVSYYDTEMK